MVNPVFLRTFCTLVETGHFTQTAEQLNITQSGVSQHIKKLEHLLGTDLIVREGKQFHLTVAGKTLYESGKAIVAALDALKGQIQTDSPLAGKVTLMTPGSVGLKLYPYLLKDQQAHPKRTIHHSFAPNHRITEAVLNHQIDFGLVTTLPDHQALTYWHITDEPLCLVTPKNAEISWQSLKSLGFINHPDGHHHANLLLRENIAGFDHIQSVPEHGFSNQIDLILLPVSLGLGFTVLPRYAVQSFKDQSQLTVHSLKTAVSEPIYLVEHKTRPQPACVEAVKALIRAHLGE